MRRGVQDFSCREKGKGKCRNAAGGGNGNEVFEVQGDSVSLKKYFICLVLRFWCVCGLADDRLVVADGSVFSTGWGGLDTFVVAAGVSALQPLLAVADCQGADLTPMPTTTEGIQKTSDVASLAIKGNYIGPLIEAVAFVRALSLSLASRPKVLTI